MAALDAIKERLAWHAARRATHDRRPVELSPRLYDRRLLVILPAGAEEQKDAWQLVRALDLDPRHVMAVTLGSPLAHVPDAYAGNVKIFGSNQVDWRGLPNKVTAATVWGWKPDVAIDLSRPFSLAAAYLVGGSSAAIRAGYFDRRSEPFFDLLYSPGDGAPAVGFTRYFSSIEPPVLPFRPARP
jgi:hypothetical protein